MNADDVGFVLPLRNDFNDIDWAHPVSRMRMWIALSFASFGGLG
jgi:hypothetical protein